MDGRKTTKQQVDEQSYRRALIDAVSVSSRLGVGFFVAAHLILPLSILVGFIVIAWGLSKMLRIDT
jgi:hypothetical protein